MNSEPFNKSTLTNLQLASIKLAEPIQVGDLPTPALTIDLEKFETNLNKMQSYLSQKGLRLRCHTKMHKSPIIAKKQLEAGAIGICCAVVSEAEVMFAAGIKNILITSPVVSADKISRVLGIAVQNEALAIVVDHIEGAKAFDRAAGEQGVKLQVYIDLDPGMARTGIQPGAPALALGRFIVDKCPNLRFTGLQMYIGNCMHVAGYSKRRDKYLHLLQKGIETKLLFEADGIAVNVFSGGGTGTYNIDGEKGALTELQAGSYLFMDVEYRDIGDQDHEQFLDFDISLHVLTTAISQPQENFITFDAGIKSLATDTAYPEFKDINGVVYHFGGDEHGIVQLEDPSTQIRLGDKHFLITPHCDPTVNLYDFYFPHRNGFVTEIWPVSARGCSQ